MHTKTPRQRCTTQTGSQPVLRSSCHDHACRLCVLFQLLPGLLFNHAHPAFSCPAYSKDSDWIDRYSYAGPAHCTLSDGRCLCNEEVLGTPRSRRTHTQIPHLSHPYPPHAHMLSRANMCMMRYNAPSGCQDQDSVKCMLCSHTWTCPVPLPSSSSHCCDPS